MNNNVLLKKTIKKIKIEFIVHSFYYGLLLVIHILIFNKINWMKKGEYIVFYIEIIIIAIFTIIPLILFILLLFLKLTKIFLNILKVFLKICYYYIFINGMIISINTWCNTQLLSIFYLNCPYNFNIADLPKIFDNYQIENKKEIKNKCNYNRCFLNGYYKDNKNNNIIYIYICNIKLNKEKMFCSELILDNQSINKDLINYVNFCRDYTKIYNCIKQDNYISYNISYDYKCPNKSEVSLNHALSFLFILFDSFIASIPWVSECTKIEEIIYLLFPDINNFNQNNQSLKETSNTSKIDDNSNSNENNQDNNSQTFKKEPTVTIIIDNNINIINDINNSKNIEKNIEILNINKNKNSNIITNENILSNKKIINKSYNNEENSKSQNQLINNNNQNIFKVINNKT